MQSDTKSSMDLEPKEPKIQIPFRPFLNTTVYWPIIHVKNSRTFTK